MEAIILDPGLLKRLSGKTAIVTGAAGGIGAAIIRLFASYGANVVVADLHHMQSVAENSIAALPDPSRALFVPVDILNWEQIKTLFKTTTAKFGSVEIVVANAGVMESQEVLNVERVDEDGDPTEPKEAFRVIDINVKGTLNNGSRGSIVLISSTSGYFGGTGVAGYVTSKHAVTGLLRSSQKEATKNRIRVNAVAPFVTPSNMTTGFAQEYIARGLEANTPEGVAKVVGTIAVDESRYGSCFLTCGKIVREMEHSLKTNMGLWLGDDMAVMMGKAMTFFEDIGGYVLPITGTVISK